MLGFLPNRVLRETSRNLTISSSICTFPQYLFCILAYVQLLSITVLFNCPLKDKNRLHYASMLTYCLADTESVEADQSVSNVVGLYPAANSARR